MNNENKIEPRIDIRVESVHEEGEVKEGGVTWNVRVINEANHIWEKRFYDDTPTEPPTIEKVRKDFFLNRQSYTHIGTCGEFNNAKVAAMRNDAIQRTLKEPASIPKAQQTNEDLFKDAELLRPLGAGDTNPIGEN